MMCRTLGIPVFHKTTRSDRKAITAVGIADLKNRPRNRFTLGDQKLQRSICILHNGQKSDRPMAHAHFHGKSPAHLSMVNLQRTNLGFTIRNFDMSWAIMPHQDNVLAQIQSVVFGERTSRAKTIHDLHRLRVLDLILPCNRNSSGRKQRTAENDGTHYIFMLLLPCTHVIVSKGTEFFLGNQPIQGNRSASRTLQLFMRTVRLDLKRSLELSQLTGDLLGG